MNIFLEFSEKEILTWIDMTSVERARLYTEIELEKYRVVQDRISMSDYDRLMIELEEKSK